MAERISNFNLNRPYWHPTYIAAGGRQIWDHSRSHWREMLAETATGVLVGGVVRYGAKAGTLSIGLSSWQAVVVGGALAGAVVGGGREWVRQSKENWRQPINPTSTSYTERLRDSLPTNWSQVGLAAGRGALFGAVGGFAGGFLADRLYNLNVGDFVNELGKRSSIVFGKPTMPWDGGWHWPGLTTPGEAPSAKIIATVGATEVAAQPTAILTPTAEITPNPTIQSTAVPKPGIYTPEPGALTPEAQQIPGHQGSKLSSGEIQIPNLTEKVAALEHNLEINQALQAEVYEKVVTEDQIVAEALKSQGKSITDLKPEQLTKVKEALQHVIEAKGNYTMDQAVKTIVIDHPTLDLTDHSNIEFVKAKQKDMFDQLFNDPTTHIDLVGIAEHNITIELTPLSVHEVAEQTTKFVTENQNNPDLFSDHVVQRGETAGHLLKLMDINPSWDGTDLHGFVALAVSNPEAFKDIASGMGMNTEDFLKLLQEAQHDPTAAQKVYKAMSLVKAGAHIKIPIHLALEEMKRRLAYRG